MMYIQDLAYFLTLDIRDVDAWNKLFREAKRLGYDIDAVRALNENEKLKEENKELKTTLHHFAFDVLNKLKDNLNFSKPYRDYILNHLDREGLARCIRGFFQNDYDESDEFPDYIVEQMYARLEESMHGHLVDFDFLAEEIKEYCSSCNNEEDNREMIDGFPDLRELNLHANLNKLQPLVKRYLECRDLIHAEKSSPTKNIEVLNSMRKDLHNLRNDIIQIRDSMTKEAIEEVNDQLGFNINIL